MKPATKISSAAALGIAAPPDWPDHRLTVAETPSIPSMPQCTTQNGSASSPNGITSTEISANGMMRKSVSGIAATLARIESGAMRWK